MAFNFNLDKRINSFDAPDFKYYYLIPSIVIYIIGLFITIYLLKNAFIHGIPYDTYEPSTCKDDAHVHCLDDSRYRNIDLCIDSYVKAKCKMIKKKTSIWIPILITLFVPFIGSQIIAFFIYKIAIYIKNPKILAGTIIYKSLFK